MGIGKLSGGEGIDWGSLFWAFEYANVVFSLVALFYFLCRGGGLANLVGLKSS